MGRIGAAAVIRDARGRVLLVRHSYGEGAREAREGRPYERSEYDRRTWEIPGGVSEPRESAGETAIREVREETGLSIAIGRLTGVYWEPQHGEDGMHHFVFLARTVDSSATPVVASPEILEVGYFSPDAPPRPISEFTIRRIEDALSGRPARFASIAERRWLE